jgi:hypothetical protein
MKILKRFILFLIFFSTLTSCTKFDCKIIEKERNIYIKNTSSKEIYQYSFEANGDELMVGYTDWLRPGFYYEINRYNSDGELRIKTIKVVGQINSKDINTGITINR